MRSLILLATLLVVCSQSFADITLTRSQSKNFGFGADKTVIHVTSVTSFAAENVPAFDMLGGDPQYVLRLTGVTQEGQTQGLILPMSSSQIRNLGLSPVEFAQLLQNALQGKAQLGFETQDEGNVTISNVDFL